MVNTDIVLLIPLAYGTFWGIYKGFISQITSMIGMVLAFCIACGSYKALAKLFSAHIHTGLSPSAISIGAFVFIFLLLLLITYLISKQFEKMADTMHLGFLNRLVGGLFGFSKWLFIESFVLFLISKFGQEIHITIIDFHHTWIYSHIEMLAPMMMDLFEKGAA